jgi:type IV secretion system protein VirD4
MSAQGKQGSDIRTEAVVAVLVLIAGIVLYERHLIWVLILIAAAAVLALVARWALIPSRTLPRNRERVMRIRLRMRVYPGPGWATLPGLWLRWGRFAMFRHSSRIRGLQPWWLRLTRPGMHSVLLGWAQFRAGLRSSLDRHVVVFSPPRQGKTGWLARQIARYPGPVVSATTKPDIFRMTSGLRSRLGPVHVFCPQAIGKLLSTFAWNLIEDCADPATAIRRADAFSDAINVKGVTDGGFWQQKSRDYLRPLFYAAAIEGATLLDVFDWISRGATEFAEAVLREAGRTTWAAQLAELRTGSDKTTATVRATMTTALSFLADPSLAAAVMPGGAQLDIAELIRSNGTLYMVADKQGEGSPLAPLFACLTNEFHYVGSMMAADYEDGHLDPPCGFFLDEVTQIVPAPVNVWMADSGGKGIQLFVVAHGRAQLAERWGEHGARIILDTAGVQVFMPGITDPDTLELAERLCGRFPGRERGSDHITRHPVMSASMLRELPDRYALIFRDNLRPVLSSMPMIWRDREYRRARRGGYLVAPTVPVSVYEPVPVAAELVPLPAAPTDSAAAWPWQLPPLGAPVGAGNEPTVRNGHTHD